jgi:NAD(P)-dependent dehydrogenase (short-subunit alcohol dehydrogenase family)
MSLFDLSDKVAVITGSTKGIGRAIAGRMAEHGARVVISSRSQADCEREAGAIEQRYGAGRALACTADLADRESLRTLVERTRAKWNALDILVLNAWFPVSGTLEMMDEKMFGEGLKVNIVNNAVLVKDALPLLKAKGGSIILISSIFGEMPVPEALLYGIVKGAFNYMATTLAVEYAPYKIRANAIAPGLTRSAMSAPIMAMPEILNPVMENVPLARPGEGDDVAAVAVLLASPGGAFITGQTINVDGGWSLEGRSARAMLQGIAKAAAKRAAAAGAGAH